MKDIRLLVDGHEFEIQRGIAGCEVFYDGELITWEHGLMRTLDICDIAIRLRGESK